MTKDEVAKALECSTRQVEKYASEERLGEVVYVKGKRGRQASYKPEEVERLKGELERERAEVIGTAAGGVALARREAPGLQQQGGQIVALLQRIAEQRPVDPRPLLLTRAEAIEASGLPPSVFSLAVKRGAIGRAFKGSATRYRRDDALTLAAREDLAELVDGWRNGK